MTSSGKYRQLISQLLEKTADGRLEWRETGEPNTFQVSFSNYSVLLSMGQTVPGGPVYRLQLLNSEGRAVDSFSAVEIGREYQEFAADLYRHARRQALGAEKAVDAILDALKSVG
jgi:hypothetical protein